MADPILVAKRDAAEFYLLPQMANRHGVITVWHPEFGQKITLVCQSALVISGEVAGDIHGDDVTVGETGKVTGTVSARNLSVHGEVNGQLRGETVALYATARITGDITQKNLVIAEGAQFDGRVRSAKDQSDWQPVLDANAHRDPNA